jgi:outer membrane assembly lipoprotein YfiO
MRGEFSQQLVRLVAIIALVLTVAACSKQPSEEEILNRAIEHQRWDEYDDAIASYQELIKRFPKSPNVPEALYAMGVVYQKKRDFPKAVATYKKLVEEYPDHPTASGAAYLRALLLRRDVRDLDSARIAYEELLKRYPNAPMIPSARTELDSLSSLLREKTAKARRPPR